MLAGGTSPMTTIPNPPMTSSWTRRPAGRRRSVAATASGLSALRTAGVKRPGPQGRGRLDRIDESHDPDQQEAGRDDQDGRPDDDVEDRLAVGRPSVRDQRADDRRRDEQPGQRRGGRKQESRDDRGPRDGKPLVDSGGGSCCDYLHATIVGALHAPARGRFGLGRRTRRSRGPPSSAPDRHVVVRRRTTTAAGASRHRAGNWVTPSCRPATDPDWGSERFGTPVP